MRLRHLCAVALFENEWTLRWKSLAGYEWALVVRDVYWLAQAAAGSSGRSPAQGRRITDFRVSHAGVVFDEHESSTILAETLARKPEDSFGCRADNRELIAIGDFRINVDTRSVTLRGRALQLSDAEFDLLVFLADHPKQLVTPQNMLSTRWPGRGARQRQFIRVLMSLREKLDAEGSAKHYILYRAMDLLSLRSECTLSRTRL